MEFTWTRFCSIEKLKLPSDCSRPFDSLLLLHHTRTYILHTRSVSLIRKIYFCAIFWKSNFSVTWSSVQNILSNRLKLLWDVWFMIINMLTVLWSNGGMSYISSRGIYILINVISGTFRWTFRTQWRENINARWQSSLRENKSNDCSTKASGIHESLRKNEEYCESFEL